MEGIEALLPSNEMPEGVRPRRGETVKVAVSNVDSADRRLTVTMKELGAAHAAEPTGHAQPKRQQAVTSKVNTLGDLLKEKLGDKLQNLTAAQEPKVEAEADVTDA
jgi:ribosomal protein S1